MANGHIGTNALSSNSAERIVRRLKRDHPEIAEALARGEFASARAAGIAADITRAGPPASKRGFRAPETAERLVKSAWPGSQIPRFLEFA